MNPVIRRIQKELLEMKNNPPLNCSAGLYNENDLLGVGCFSKIFLGYD